MTANRGKTTPASTAGSFIAASGPRSRAAPAPEPVAAGARVLVAGEPGEALEVVGGAAGATVVVRFDAGDRVEVLAGDVVVEDIGSMGADQLTDLLGRYTEDDFESAREMLDDFDGGADVALADVERVRAWMGRYDRLQDALFAMRPADVSAIGDDDPF